MYEQIIADLRKSYSGMVDERDIKQVMGWKAEERESFLSLLHRENKTRLLEIGAGTGLHGKFFQDGGMAVVCTDLSTQMVKRCIEKGLKSYEMDFLNLTYPADSFEAVFAMNCLLHAPRDDLSRILGILHVLLEEGGVFYWGQYGGIERAGPYEGDHYRPKRFFSFLTDEQIEEVAQEHFRIHVFRTVDLESEEEIHFQSMILRKG